MLFSKNKKCSHCDTRVCWIEWNGISRFNQVFRFHNFNSECTNCLQTIENTGELGGDRLIIGIHSDSIIPNLSAMNSQTKDCGILCNKCAGHKVCK